MADIRGVGPDRGAFEANAQRVGGQRDAVGQGNLARTAGADDAKAAAQENDAVEITQRGQEAGEHVGVAQDLASQARRLGNARDGMSQGVKPGDVDPARAEKAAGGSAKEEPTVGGPPPEDPSTPGTPGTGEPSGAEAAAAKAKEAQDDAEKANQIYMQMALDREKAFMQMWKMIQDTNAEIARMMQEAAAYRAKVTMAMAEAWDACIRGA